MVSFQKEGGMGKAIVGLFKPLGAGGGGGGLCIYRLFRNKLKLD